MTLMELAQYSGALGIGTLIPWGWKQLTRTMSGAAERELTRIESLEDLVDFLRRALDKGRFREDSLAQVLSVLIFGLKGIENLSPALSDAMERAIAILKGAQGQLRSMSEAE